MHDKHAQKGSESAVQQHGWTTFATTNNASVQFPGKLEFTFTDYRLAQVRTVDIRRTRNLAVLSLGSFLDISQRVFWYSAHDVGEVDLASFPDGSTDVSVLEDTLSGTPYSSLYLYPLEGIHGLLI